MTISEERRLVTVLFVDMVGFTSRSDMADPEAVREMQRAYFEAVSTEVTRYGGTVEKYIGDAVMALYGVPRAHDDDAERALHAALGIRDALEGGSAGVEVRIGANTGEVVGGAGPGPQAGEYTVTGDAVNVAARLQQAARPGEIWVGPTTRRLAAEAFDFAPLPPLELKGKADPVEAWRLVRVLAERPRVRGGETPLVGRRRELTLLESALEAAADAGGLLVGLSGEAGIGKSRMALELRRRAEALGFESGWATALSYASSFPYHLVAQLVEQLLRRGPDDAIGDALSAVVPATDPETLERWAAALADVAGGADDAQRRLLADATPAALQRLVIQALGGLLAGRAARRPQLIVLDDLHWADASSLAVLDEVLGLIPDHPVVVLALYRPGWTNPWATRSFYQQLNLDRLRDEDALELVGALSAGQSMEPGRAEQLLHRSGGNPFFLEELVRERGGDGTDAGRMPETVHELLLARIDALPADARGVLQVAAVIGMEFSERLLAAVEPADAMDEALAALQRDNLIVPRGGDERDRTFAMRHPLVHEVASRSLLRTRRRDLHRRIGEWLEVNGGDEALAAMAAHFREGDDLERARTYLPRAAERAARLNAPREARDWYLEAAELFRDDAQRRAEVLERAAFLSYLVGDVGRAIELVTEAGRLFEAAGDRLRALDTRRLLGRYYWMDGHGRRAETEVIAAIEGLEQLPRSPELALAYSYRAQIRMLMPDYPIAIRLARQAIDVANEVGSTEALVHALNNLGVALMGEGDMSGIEHLRRSLALSLEHNLPDDAARAYTNLSAQGTAGISLYTPEEAYALFAEMLAYDQRAAPGGIFEQWHLETEAELWIAHGRWDEAERRLADLADIAGANRYFQVNVGSYRALVASHRGRHDEAARIIRPVVEMAVEINDLQAYGCALIAAAHAERGLGNAAAAIDAIERGIRLRGDAVEGDISAFYLFEAVDVLSWLARDPDADADLVARGRSVLGELSAALEADAGRGGTEPQLLVRNALRNAATRQLQLLGLRPSAADADQLAAPLREYAADLRRARRVFDAARAELWLAEATGDRTAAQAAAETFSELGAAPYAARAQAVPTVGSRRR